MKYFASFDSSTFRLFSATEAKNEQLETSIKQITHKYTVYGDDAAVLLAAFVNASTPGRSLLHESYNKMENPGKEG